MNTEEKKQSRLIKKQKRNILIVVMILAAMIIADFVWSNTYIEVKELSAKFEKLPDGFDSCKIVQISDFHNEWGSGYIDRLTNKVKDCNPDYIFVTGDSVDQLFPDVDRSLELMKKLPDICPVYLVLGNHEYGLSQEDREKFIAGCESYGINVLYNEHTTLTRNGDSISLLGFDDMQNESEAFSQVADDFVILLNHYPEDCAHFSNMALQSGTHIDIDFTGHAHGGLIRLPLVNGLYAPGQGFFPEYTDGTYTIDDTTLVVSRGVGNSGLTQRFSDPFELVVFTLEK
ncbi:metallophosphoesterase [Ruminococcus sp.]|uniref:metallophosphoesterase n=1 Tax=Ruminococcus sp. TaxID=41978 RepID=UPI0025EFD2EC|nr:metallophosphoesterase [Ruminococcus sp.]